jgi:hypothetical protein
MKSASGPGTWPVQLRWLPKKSFNFMTLHHILWTPARQYFSLERFRRTLKTAIALKRDPIT